MGIFTHFNHFDFHKLKLSLFGFGNPELSEAELKRLSIMQETDN